MLSTRTGTSVIPSPATVRQTLTSSPNQPSTPQSSSATVVSPSPGTFQHPRLREIVSRQSRSSFTSRNVQTILVNTVVLLGSYITSDAITSLMTRLANLTSTQAISDLTLPVLNVFRLLLFLNVLLSLRPVLTHDPQATGLGYFLTLLSTASDPITDIPLTPTQRALLGLPRSAQNTPDSAPGVFTPPRYRRTSGSPQPNSESRHSITANIGSSPLSVSRAAAGASPLAFGTPASGRTAGASPIQSPLFQKTALRNESLAESTASGISFDGSLRRSQSMYERSRKSSLFVPDTPSPVSREREKKAVPGVNYKWLYEKGL